MLKSKKQFRAVRKLSLPSVSRKSSREFADNFWDMTVAVNPCPFCFNGMSILLAVVPPKSNDNTMLLPWEEIPMGNNKKVRKIVLKTVLEQVWNCAQKLSFMWLKFCLSLCAYCFPSHVCLWGPRFSWLETQSMNLKENLVYVNLGLWQEPVTSRLCSQIY